VTQQSRLLFDGFHTLLPNVVRVDPITDVRLIEDTTGNLVNIFSVVGVGGVVGTGGVGVYSAPSGGCIDWLTGFVHGKHLMVGRTFVVPMIAAAYTATGGLSGATVTTLGTAAETMRTANPAHPFGVWGRPRKAFTRPDGTVRPALTGHFAPAISSRIPAKAVVLRSRRD
jgi:hypothetical protein